MILIVVFLCIIVLLLGIYFVDIVANHIVKKWFPHKYEINLALPVSSFEFCHWCRFYTKKPYCKKGLRTSKIVNKRKCKYLENHEEE